LLISFLLPVSKVFLLLIIIGGTGFDLEVIIQQKNHLRKPLCKIFLQTAPLPEHIPKFFV
jgi:hypothetical protein